MSLVAEEDGRVVGHILFSDLPIVTAGGTVGPWRWPRWRCSRSTSGRGSARCWSGGAEGVPGAGHRIVVVLGHPEFYPRFGFSAKLAGRLKSPFSGPAFMAVELVPGAWRR